MTQEATSKYDERHGGPYDRGGADAYYKRHSNPHYYVGFTDCSKWIGSRDMTKAEIAAYKAGYKDEVQRQKGVQ